ncbi:MAG: AIDA repeat-containing protein, partial [Clostridia bacterium]|nr:AIDA repeat-containing protein [Clostridia bacterium]
MIYKYIVSSGIKSSGIILDSENMAVLYGGTAKNTIVNSGEFEVSSGGTAIDTTINTDGFLYVWHGGSATGIKENGGFVSVAYGADVSFRPNSFANSVVYVATVHSGTTANNIS